MSNYLRGDNQKFIATHIEEMEKSNMGRGIYFCFDTVKNGETAYGILDSLFPGLDHRIGLDKRDFTFFFDSKKRNEVYDGLSEDIRNYSVAHDEEVNSGYGEDEVPEANDPEVGEAGGDTATYVVIGAVAAIIILLLIWRK